MFLKGKLKQVLKKKVGTCKDIFVDQLTAVYYL